MRSPTVRSVALAAFLLGALPGGFLCPLFLQAATASNSEHPPFLATRAVTFDFAGLDASGDIQLGKPLKLSLTLNGVAHGRIPMVAVCESAHFQPHIVTMDPDPLSKTLRATVILEPIATGTLSVIPQFARIRVTFARSITDKKLERVMTRIVYVTLDKPDTEHSAVELSSPAEDNPVGEHMSDEDLPPDALPIANASLVEEDLLPLPEPGLGQAYWQQVSARLSRSWSRTARRVRHAPSSEIVRVRFRMYPNGRAQLIEIEKGSGAREIDEAGIHAIIHAQPFPPFPEDIGSEPVEVHVRMRTGVQKSTRGAQQVSDSLTPRPHHAPALIPKP